MAQFNPDLARRILFVVETIPPTNQYATITFEEHTPEEISYHIKKLSESGLVVAADASTESIYQWEVRELTPEGHKFIEDLRDNNIWSKAKAEIKAKGIPMTLVAIKAVVAKILKDKTGLDI